VRFDITASVDCRSSGMEKEKWGGNAGIESETRGGMKACTVLETGQTRSQLSAGKSEKSRVGDAEKLYCPKKKEGKNGEVED